MDLAEVVLAVQELVVLGSLLIIKLFFMKKLFYICFIISIVGLTGFSLNSCRKAEREELKEISSENSLAEGIFDDVFRQVDNSYDGIVNYSKSASSGATVTILPNDSITYPKTLTIDFGDGVTDARAVTRKGKIIAVFSGHYKDSGTIITVSLENYYRDQYQVTGSKTIVNKGVNANGNLEYSVDVINASITSDEGTISWDSKRTREWTAGYSTPWPKFWDDEYLISGTASGTSMKGKKFDIKISEPLLVKFDCKWISSGKIEITPAGADPRIIDFGNGDCDEEATLTIRNKTYNITLGY